MFSRKGPDISNVSDPRRGQSGNEGLEGEGLRIGIQCKSIFLWVLEPDLWEGQVEGTPVMCQQARGKAKTGVLLVQWGLHGGA